MLTPSETHRWDQLTSGLRDDVDIAAHVARGSGRLQGAVRWVAEAFQAFGISFVTIVSARGAALVPDAHYEARRKSDLPVSTRARPGSR